ncbi:MAG TPA: MMPL family transporter [Verrucomicrobiae bacterium]
MKRRWLLLLLVPVLLGLVRLRFDTDVLNLLPNDLPAVAGLKLYHKYFANTREVIITVTAKNSADAETAARSIAAKLQAATNLIGDAVWQAPWMDRPEETAEFIAWLWLSQPPEEVAKLASRLNPTNAIATLDDTRERLATSLSPLDLARLSHDPFGLTALGPGLTPQSNDWFASPDGTFRLIFVQPRTDPGSFAKWPIWLDQFYAVIKTADVPSDVELGYTGTPIFTVETATGMQSDMRQSIASTIILVGLLFWWAHRRFWPLLWMLVMLVSSLLITMSFGGLIFGSLNVVSFGFAAILLGLGVDYSLVLYQELLDHPIASATEIRHEAAPGIWWSSSTTAFTFALLNFAGLPGLGQLGTLVAIGVMLAATAMLYGFLPLMTRRPPAARATAEPATKPTHDRFAWPVTIAAAFVAAFVLTRWWPQIDRSAQPLGSVNSQAAKAAQAIDKNMNHGTETLWLIIQGRDETEIRARLEKLKSEVSKYSAELPLDIWPAPDRQKQNLAAVRNLDSNFPALEKSAAEAGFTDEALALTKSILNSWRNFPTNTAPIWPSGSSTRWLVNRIAAKSENGMLALGLLHLPANSPLPEIHTPGVLLAGWSRLAELLLQRVEHRLLFLTFGMLAVLIICLRLALRGWTEVFLSCASLAFGFMLTLLVMAIFRWKWNLLSLTAIPLLLGASVDYTIHVQLALNRYRDDARAMRRTIGRALFLVTAAAVAGFGSLGLASNAGLASFEILCAIGMICIFLTSLYLLPAWHYTLARTRDTNG